MIQCLYDQFKKWSYYGAVYIISDTHFGEPQCKQIDPNWPDPKEYIMFLRKYATGNETIIHLGDVGDPQWMDKLPGYKVLIMGNHDTKSVCDAHFQEVYEGPLYIGKKILLSHEPVYVPGAINIHGHEHGDTATHGERTLFAPGAFAQMNRAANVCGYQPLNLGAAIRGGLLSGIKDIHRLTIDAGVDRKNGIDRF